jgi:hypothetical protein
MILLGYGKDTKMILCQYGNDPEKYIPMSKKIFIILENDVPNHKRKRSISKNEINGLIWTA